MKIYKNFNELYNFSKTIKSNVSTFNKIKRVQTVGGGKSFMNLYIADDKTGNTVIELFENGTEPDSFSRIPFYMNIDYSLLSCYLGDLKDDSYYETASSEIIEKEYEKYNALKPYLREFCTSKIQDYCATHYIDVRGNGGGFEFYIPPEAVNEFAQYLDGLVGECKKEFKHWYY